ncbi:MAG: AAA family ATPase [Myxococcota bacterium]
MRARENPFRTSRLDALAYRPRGESIERLLARWERQGRRGVVVGAHGSGKTTLLRALAARFTAGGKRVVSWRFSEAQPVPTARALWSQARRLPPEAVLFVDGVEQLSAAARLGLVRAASRAHGWLFTAHDRGSLPVVHETRVDPALLAELVRTLLGPGARGLGPLLDGLRRRRQDNLREVFLDLYDLASRDDPRILEALERSSAPPSLTGPPVAPAAMPASD